MKITVTKCDGCGTISEEPFREEGWLIFSDQNGHGDVTIQRTGGKKDAKGEPTAAFLQHVEAICSVACLVKTLDKSDERDRRTNAFLRAATATATATVTP